MGKVTLTFQDISKEQAEELLTVFNGNEEEEEEEEEVVKPKSKKKASKKKASKKSEDEDDDMGIDDDGEDDGDDDDISKDDLIKAFKKYVKKFDDVKKGRTQAKKVLKKFKSANVDDIDEDDYAAVMKVLTKK